MQSPRGTGWGQLVPEQQAQPGQCIQVPVLQVPCKQVLESPELLQAGQQVQQVPLERQVPRKQGQVALVQLVQRRLELLRVQVAPEAGTLALLALQQVA